MVIMNTLLEFKTWEVALCQLASRSINTYVKNHVNIAPTCSITVFETIPYSNVGLHQNLDRVC